jgi:hypothetical protein
LQEKDTCEKKFSLLICLLFGIPFTTLGFFYGVLPILKTSHQWLEVRSWEPVPAQVLAAELNSPKFRTRMSAHRVEAQYRFVFDGTTQLIALD